MRSADGRPRRISPPSMMSSCRSVAEWISSSATAASIASSRRAGPWPTRAAWKTSSTTVGRMRFPPAPTRCAAIWCRRCSRDPSSAASRASTRARSASTGGGSRAADRSAELWARVFTGAVARLNSKALPKSRMRRRVARHVDVALPGRVDSVRRMAEPTPEEVREALRAVLFPGFRRDIVALGMVGDECTSRTAWCGSTCGRARDKPEVVDELAPSGPGGARAPARRDARRGARRARRGGARPRPVRGARRAARRAARARRGEHEGRGRQVDGGGEPRRSRSRRADSGVGLLDADVYGPSVPIMFGTEARPRGRRPRSASCRSSATGSGSCRWASSSTSSRP